MTSQTPISFPCPVCDSRIYADRSDDRVVCPDCLESVPVPPELRRPVPIDMADDDEPIPVLDGDAPAPENPRWSPGGSSSPSEPHLGDDEEDELRLEPLEDQPTSPAHDLPHAAPGVPRDDQLEDDELHLEPLDDEPLLLEPGPAGASEPIPGGPAARRRRSVEGRFGVTCPVCETRIDVSESQIGSSVTCPDCGSPTLVEPPPKEKIQRVEWDDAATDDYRLSQPEEVEIYKEIAKESEERAAKEEEIEVERKRKVDVPLPPNPLREGVWQAFSSVNTWLIIGIMTFIFTPTIAVGYLAAKIDNTALATAITIILGLPTSLLAMFGSGVMGITVLQESAEGYDEIQDIPPFNILDWIGDGAYCVLASLYAIVPAGPFVSLVIAFAPWWVTSALVAISWFIFYPIALTSMLENATVWYPISKTVLKTLKEKRSCWREFYWRSAVLAIPVAAVLAIPISFWLSPLPAFAAAVGWVAYHRLLGRLVWWISSED